MVSIWGALGWLLGGSIGGRTFRFHLLVRRRSIKIKINLVWFKKRFFKSAVLSIFHDFNLFLVMGTFVDFEVKRHYILIVKPLS